MGLYRKEFTQKIPASIDTVWDFISSPRNLKHITPEYMGFDILTPNLPEKMYKGMIIHYKVSPILGIPMQWVTEITHVQDKEYFVDEQRMGPYRIWHHEHWIKPIDGGVLMTDILHYQPPFGIIGDIANALLINRQVDSIFRFRTEKVNTMFGILP